MAKDEIRNGQREYGIVHVVEEEMRASGQGVFAPKNAGSAPTNKALKSAPADKAEASMSMTKDELLKAAKAANVDVESDDNKADLVRKINAAN